MSCNKIIYEITNAKFPKRKEITMEDNIIVLEDENGNQIEFATIDVFEFNNETYFALLEVVDEGEETDEVLIMKVDNTDEENPELIMVEDEQELEAAFEEFLKRDEEFED